MKQFKFNYQIEIEPPFTDETNTHKNHFRALQYVICNHPTEIFNLNDDGFRFKFNGNNWTIRLQD